MLSLPQGRALIALFGNLCWGECQRVLQGSHFHICSIFSSPMVVLSGSKERVGGGWVPGSWTQPELHLHRDSPGHAPSGAPGEHPIPRERAVRGGGVINSGLFLSNLTCVNLLVGSSENVLGKLLIWGPSAPRKQCLPMACKRLFGYRSWVTLSLTVNDSWPGS